MKIAFFVDLFPRLSETFILNQITGLIDRGHEVDIYAHGSGNEPKIHKDVERYDLLKRTFYYGTFHKKIPANKFLRLLKGINLIITNVHKKPIALLRSLNVAKFKKEAASLGILYKITPFLDCCAYDIVHCHFGPNGNLGALLKDIGAIKGKVVTTFHGYDMSSYIQKYGDEVYRYLFRKGDLFLPISERWKDKLIKLGCNEEKIFVHRMGIDTQKYQFSVRKPKNNGAINILTVARLVEKKGVRYGIQAIAKILQKYQDIEYKIIGDGHLKNELETLAANLNLKNNVEFLGWKSQEEIIELMKDADIFLAPSVTSEDGDQEGIPVVLMEAMAQGLPVVSTCHSGIPELVRDGETGFLAPERDPDVLAEKLIYLIENQESWPKIGKAGRKYIDENYDINKLNDRLVATYQRLLSKDGI
jgi:colanic acid/amylovoran biosynthesis glycosyltransferase